MAPTSYEGLHDSKVFTPFVHSRSSTTVHAIIFSVVATAGIIIIIVIDNILNNIVSLLKSFQH